jgi:hypothetical protein
MQQAGRIYVPDNSFFVGDLFSRRTVFIRLGHEFPKKQLGFSVFNRV